MKKKSNSKPVDLAGLLTIKSAGDAKMAVLQALEQADDVTLLISVDCDVDMAGIQIVVAARLEAQNVSKKLSLSAPITGRVRDIVQSAGILESLSAEDRQFWTHEQVQA